MKEKDVEAGIQEWNNDVTGESVKEEFGNDPNKVVVDEEKNARLAAVNWSDENAVKKVTDEDIAYAERTLAEDLATMANEQKALQQKIGSTKNHINKLEKQLAQAQAQNDAHKISQLTKQIQDKKLAVAQLENALREIEGEI